MRPWRIISSIDRAAAEHLSGPRILRYAEYAGTVMVTAIVASQAKAFYDHYQEHRQIMHGNEQPVEPEQLPPSQEQQ